MTELHNAPLDALLQELGRRPAELVKAALVAMPVPCMLLTCEEYEADIAKAQAGIDRFTSSCEVGTPSKAGVAKVYFDPANLVEAKARAANALAVREFMMGGGASQ